LTLISVHRLILIGNYYVFKNYWKSM